MSLVKLYKYKPGTFIQPSTDPFDLSINNNPYIIPNEFNKYMVVITENDEIIRTFNFNTNNGKFCIENKNLYYSNVMIMLDKVTGLSSEVKQEIIQQYNNL
jgi:hypothetical protein